MEIILESVFGCSACSKHVEMCKSIRYCRILINSQRFATENVLSLQLPCKQQAVCMTRSSGTIIIINAVQCANTAGLNQIAEPCAEVFF